SLCRLLRTSGSRGSAVTIWSKDYSRIRGSPSYGGRRNAENPFGLPISVCTLHLAGITAATECNRRQSYMLLLRGGTGFQSVWMLFVGTMVWTVRPSFYSQPHSTCSQNPTNLSLRSKLNSERIFRASYSWTLSTDPSSAQRARTKTWGAFWQRLKKSLRN